ncbi:MAG: FtsX-like permease family protein [Oscillospiraceae bacterium]|jgi:putative ABC transport system permease protein|nr:FtsX-like permease family protein [Oscillospiraceae bacterium]
MKNALFKDILRTISKSKARFFSVIAIVALGVAFLAGMNATPVDMLKTAEDYFYQSNLMDICVTSTAGMTDTDIYAIMTKNSKQIQSFMPAKIVDGLLYMDGNGLVDIDGSAFTCRAISMDFDMVREFEAQNPDYPNYKDGKVQVNDVSYINRLTLLEGRYPELPYECLVDDSALSTPDEFAIGKFFTVKGDREDLSKSLLYTTFKIVGIIRTPTYVNFERGNTTIGTGKLGTFVYVPQQTFLKSYYSMLYLKLQHATPTDFNGAYDPNYTRYVDNIIANIEELSATRLPIRRAALNAELTEKLADGNALLAEKEKEFEVSLAAAQKQLEDAEYYSQHGDEELAKKKAEFEATLNENQRKWFAAQDELNANTKEYNEAAAKLAEALKVRDENPNYKADYESARVDLQNAKARIDNAEKQIKSMESLLTTVHGFLDGLNANSPWESMMQSLRDVGLSTEIIDKMKAASAVSVAGDVLNYAEPTLAQYEDDLAVQKQELADGKLEYLHNYVEWLSKADDIAKLDNLAVLQQQLDEKRKLLDTANADLKLGAVTLTAAQSQGQYELVIAQQQIEQAKAAYPTAQQTFNKKKAEAEEKLQDAKYELEAAQTTLDNLDKTRWIVDGRDALPGNSSYEQNADNVKILGTIFPIVFFAVAALVVLTTVARMVEEERTQMGTLKALGYEETAIAWKYIFYALLAGGIGSLIGLGIGFTALPFAVNAAFGIMFDMPPIELSFRWGLAAIGVAVSLACSVGAAFFACWREMRTNPAQLMRPKAPKAGKRVLFERIPIIWNTLNFTGKVTVRNLFRNKRRFMTTFIGIAGASALLLASFGLGDSIRAIINYQYGAGGISQQDVQLVLRDPQDPDNTSGGILAALNAQTQLGSKMPVAMKVLNAGSENAPNEPLQEVNILVPADASRMGEIANLRERTGKVPLMLADTGVIVTEMFADRANVDVNDYIFIHNSDGFDVKVRVIGVAENYTFNYIYMTRTVYEAIFLAKPEFNMVYAQLNSDIRAMGETERNTEKAALSTKLMNIDGVSAVVYTTQVVDSFSNIVKSLNYVILVFIIAAAALAFVVLFNLSNINVNERLREIATIKVLGFYDNEVSAYIYRENILLTLLGMAGGAAGGIFMHRILAGVVKINVVMLGQTLEWTSYLWAMLLTAGFAVLVNLLMHRRLKKVSMVESLKSVE